MRLLEFQAKEVFSEYGISLLKGAVSTDIGKAREDAKMIGYPMVVKSQVPVGGRGKAGGIQICKNADELSIKYPQVMELEIKGERARAILIEEAAVIKNEMYLSLFLNRSKRCYTVIASAEGGVEIESVKNQIIKEVGRGNVDEQTASEIASEMGLRGVVIVGEIGGDAEEIIAQRIIDTKFSKPVVAYIAGRAAPKEKRMGHAGAIVYGNYGSAESKVSMFGKANVPVAKRPQEVPVLLATKIRNAD